MRPSIPCPAPPLCPASPPPTHPSPPTHAPQLTHPPSPTHPPPPTHSPSPTHPPPSIKATCVHSSTLPPHCEQVLQHSKSGSSQPDEWTLILMRLRFPGSHTGHICLRFHLARSSQDARVVSRIEDKPARAVRHADSITPAISAEMIWPSRVIFGHFRPSQGKFRQSEKCK